MHPYENTLKHLYARSGAGYKLGLTTIHALLRALGNPHIGKHFVVVAGTNGKGSTCALLARALKLGGYRVGLYTSPHLLRFTERIRIDDEEIDPQQVVGWYDEIKRAESLCPRPPTFFECTTAMALCAFAKHRVDIAVLEVGLGGRLDATNVVHKTLGVITPIALDHQLYLGNTLTAIAAEKAAIIDDNNVVIVAPQHQDAHQVIAKRCIKKNATLIAVAPEQNHAALLSTSPHLAHYQRTNVATALAAFNALGDNKFVCPAFAFAEAVRDFTWVGRYQWLASDLLVDSAHNPHGMAALCASIGQDPKMQHRAIHCVFTSLQDKPVHRVLRSLQPLVKAWYATPLKIPRSRSPENLKTLLPKASVYPNATEALNAARKAAEQDRGVVLVTGSLFLVAEVLGVVAAGPQDPPIAS